MKFIPEYFKRVIRFCYYRNERNKVYRERLIRKNQNKQLQLQYSSEIEKLIIFVVGGASWFTGKDEISGGIMSIASIYEETVKLKEIHCAEVIMVTSPDAHLLLKHTQFPNDIPLYRFNQLSFFSNLHEVTIHIPEYMFKPLLIEKLRQKLSPIKVNQFHLNILNQRIDIMPTPEVINSIRGKGYYVTQTTAHEQYSNIEIREKYGVPLHKLSVYATPERYDFRPYSEKEDIILVSPDMGELKDLILEKIKRELPRFEVIIISGITYMKYLELIQRAKYMITLGEGLDFYFIETVFSGGVSFAVYNQDFFTPSFEHLNGVFDSYQSMVEKIDDVINKAETDLNYFQDTNGQQFEACHKIYNGDFYKQNLIDFYTTDYLFP
ncbi:hypothetical protein PEPS_08880 [Persicobacter psychrovividus]|uniref:Glycosyltransferase family 1 protein n=2 Tax=Persicobacter psychrovividus TaxID=387638 RepID=A0ABN6L607_9BACT|nr:hypothetical protein PEPS_08880 [Persicobacter psychrovividus]